MFFCEETAKAKLGAAVPRVKGRVRRIQGGLSGGTAASGAATMAAVQKDPAVLGILTNPFALTPGFEGLRSRPARRSSMTTTSAPKSGRS